MYDSINTKYFSSYKGFIPTEALSMQNPGIKMN